MATGSGTTWERPSSLGGGSVGRKKKSDNVVPMHTDERAEPKEESQPEGPPEFVVISFTLPRDLAEILVGLSSRWQVQPHELARDVVHEYLARTYAEMTAKQVERDTYERMRPKHPRFKE